jgi:hypothetical protein
MSMDPIPPADDSAGEASPMSDAKKNIARAVAALEIAAGSPEFQTAAGAMKPGDEFVVASNSDGGALVTCGDVDVEVPAEMIDAEVPEDLAEIEEMPDPEAT